LAASVPAGPIAEKSAAPLRLASRRRNGTRWSTSAESILVGEEKVLILGGTIENKTGKGHGDSYDRGRVRSGAIYVSERQVVPFRAIVIQPHYPLRSSFGFAQGQRGRRKLHDTAVSTANRIFAKLHCNRVGSSHH